MAPRGTPGEGFKRYFSICIYTLLTILPVYHYRPRYTGEGVREARAWVWQLAPAIAGARASPGGGICFSTIFSEDRPTILGVPQVNVAAPGAASRYTEPFDPQLIVASASRIVGGGGHEGAALKATEFDPVIKVRAIELYN